MLDIQSIFGWTATVLFGLCYIPQILKTFRLKSVGDVSLWQWVVQLIGYACGLIFALCLKNCILIFGYSWGLFCTIIFLILYFKYREKHVQNNF
jgi:uncharacterized protein with PQ loop repeat